MRVVAHAAHMGPHLQLTLCCGCSHAVLNRLPLPLVGRLVLVVQSPLLERQQPGTAAAAVVRRRRRRMRKLRLRVKTVMAMTWVLGIQVLQLTPGDGAFKDIVVVPDSDGELAEGSSRPKGGAGWVT